MNATTYGYHLALREQDRAATAHREVTDRMRQFERSFASAYQREFYRVRLVMAQERSRNFYAMARTLAGVSCRSDT